MRTKPWVHVALDAPDVESEIRRSLRPTGLFCVLDGGPIDGLDDFYCAIEQTVPLVRGFGRNLDALHDLFRTFGCGQHAGKSHCFIWRGPARLIAASSDDFDRVADIVVGASKELLVGDELDPTFDPSDEADWIPTRLDLVFLAESTDGCEQLVSKLSRLSEDWADQFKSLDIRVDVLPGRQHR